MPEEEKVAASAVDGKQFEMSREEYDTKMRAVTLGESDTMPDGTLVADVRKNIQEAEARQDAERAAMEYKTFEDVVPPSEDTGNIRVTMSQSGVAAEDPIMTEAIQTPGPTPAPPSPTPTPPVPVPTPVPPSPTPTPSMEGGETHPGALSGSDQG